MDYTKPQEILNLINETLVHLGMPERVGTLPFLFNNRTSTRLGTAYLTKGYIDLSAKLWPLTQPHKRYETIIHEVCHMVNHWMGRRDSHGAGWSSLMIKCGLEPNARYCAEYAFGENQAAAKAIRPKRTRYVYKCSCGQTSQFTSIVYNRMRQGKNYRCGCSSRVVFENITLSE